MTIRSQDKGQDRETGITADALLTVIQGLLDETAETNNSRHKLNLESRLEHDLGLNSLARAELVSRINGTFSIILPDEALLAETPHGLLSLMTRAAGMAEAETPRAHREQQAAVSTLPSAASTLMEVLAWHLEHQPERVHILHYGNREDPDEMSYRDLWQGAIRVASALWERSVRPGDRVALMLPTG
ncbi:MAG: acyl-phosphate glycerol 3-phosphate acyltransferase, partial [Candidatus Thiodiazotropha sp. (ex Clathrolucina costata)]|nr:acyl-phosphate glycerol 3-phosphate acyltransferase [Candidatus Thiodiazotropha taylori]